MVQGRQRDEGHFGAEPNTLRWVFDRKTNQGGTAGFGKTGLVPVTITLRGRDFFVASVADLF